MESPAIDWATVCRALGFGSTIALVRVCVEAAEVLCFVCVVLCVLEGLCVW